VYDDFTFQGRYREDNAEELLEELVSLASNLDDTDWKTLKEKGYVRFTGVGMSPVYRSNCTDIKPDETIVGNLWHTDKKVPWPTLTRRMQFYIDHPFFQELGEVLPVHKDNPPMGGDYPLQMIGGHSRWSIHAMWRDNNLMQRLERGEPTVLIGTEDAADRGIVDADRVKVYNDLGDFEVMAKIVPGQKPGQVMFHHAWEPFQFKDGKSHQSLIPSPMNPLDLAGGYFHLQPMILMQSPGSPDRGTRVEVEKLA
jgi:nitrate reductase alpha subunit